ncbi:Dna-J like membrane chaperone protein [Enhygromyxa salina]|uniref:Dna-J like membrane chaperone protein n=1 Tax=Enhygromyxa salina TaxID=215803 RepID=A0A2S9XFT8_9BACT|nr:Dna-J like membrane chaperone protein [Enhygromyxa salina]
MSAGRHTGLVGIGKRLWNVARANVSDFSSAFSLDPEVRERRRLDDELEREVAKEVADTIGAKAGRRARRVASKAEDAWERAFEEARARGRRGAGASASASEIEGWYRTLEVPADADFATVRKSYRRLVAKYHPDKYAADPEKYAAATEVARKITTAYNGLKAMSEP